MNPRRQAMVIIAVLAISTFALYGRRLNDAPVYLLPDEATIAVDAHAIASTGRDVTGEFLPLFFKITDDLKTGWFMPLIFYVTALFLKVTPLSESAVRLPTVFMAVLNVVLVYVVAEMFRRRALAVLAAVLVMLTPAHLMHARFAMDYMYPLPFFLAWLLCLVTWMERREGWLLAAAGACLGLGFYSYISSVLLMPVYLLFTWLVLVQTSQPRRSYVVVTSAFAVALLPFAAWLATHPSAFADTAQRYGLYDAGTLNAVQGARSYLSYSNIGSRVSVYWSFLNPLYLFFVGSSRAIFTTSKVGVFLLAVAPLLAVGLWQVVTTRKTPIHQVLLLGFVSAPIAAVLVDETAVGRELEVVPLTILLATIGVDYLWSAQILERPRTVLIPLGVAGALIGAAYAAWTMATQGRLTRTTLALIAGGVMLSLAGLAAERVRLGRLVVMALLLGAAMQFRSFYVDYFGDYRLRSAFWYGGNIGGALEEVIERSPREGGRPIYLAKVNRWLDSYWRFYLIKHDRQDLLARTFVFDPAAFGSVPAGSLVLADAGDATIEAFVKAGALRRVASITQADGAPTYELLERSAVSR